MFRLWKLFGLLCGHAVHWVKTSLESTFCASALTSGLATWLFIALESQKCNAFTGELCLPLVSFCFPADQNDDVFYKWKDLHPTQPDWAIAFKWGRKSKQNLYLVVLYDLLFDAITKNNSFRLLGKACWTEKTSVCVEALSLLQEWRSVSGWSSGCPCFAHFRNWNKTDTL